MIVKSHLMITHRYLHNIYTYMYMYILINPIIYDIQNSMKTINRARNKLNYEKITP